MSEYQYYEFQALDKPLDERALTYLRKLSSRASITPTSFVNVYNYGDFRGNPRLLMEKYFDAFVYVANWGTNELMFRLPRKAVDGKTLAAYSVDDRLSVTTKGRYSILDFCSQEEGADWVSGEGWLATLIPLRNDILNGDMRSLYLGWLACVEDEDENETAVEPPVPAGLADLSGAYRALAEFLRIDDSLIEAAAFRSTELRPTVTKTRLRGWIRSISAAKKDSLLLDLMQSKAPQEVQARLLNQFRDQAHPAAAPRSGGRTVAELLDEAQQIAHRKRREAATRAERERMRRKRKAELARAKRLDKLAARQPAAWRDIEELVSSVQPKNYAEAVRLLQDLQALAIREKKQKKFAERLRSIRTRYGRKRAFMAALGEAGLR